MKYIINKNDIRQFTPQEKMRYAKRSFSESSFAQIKLNYLPRYILVRGIKKVQCLLNLGISVITAVQIIKYA
jgi:hypothetical protein